MKIRSGTWHEFTTAERSETGPLVVDLSEARWADPVVAAGTAAVVQRAVANGRQVSFVPPRSSDTSGYLARMRLGTALEELGISHGLPTVNERNQEGRLLELRTFSTEHDGEELAGLVYDRLEDAGQVEQQVREPMQNALMELAINTSFHAGVKHGYAIAQTYPAKREIKFCVADSGRGLKASLDRNAALHPVDDEHALEMAVIRQISGTDDDHRGYGLPDVVETVRGFGGVTEIASGTASARFQLGQDDGDVANMSYTSVLPSAYDGVIVQVTLPWAPGR